MPAAANTLGSKADKQLFIFLILRASPHGRGKKKCVGHERGRWYIRSVLAAVTSTNPCALKASPSESAMAR